MIESQVERTIKRAVLWQFRVATTLILRLGNRVRVPTGAVCCIRALSFMVLILTPIALGCFVLGDSLVTFQCPGFVRNHPQIR